MEEIENISDQILLFSEEIATTIQEIRQKFKCSEDQATKIVSLGLNSMFIEVLHHKLGKLVVDDLTIFNEVTYGR